MKEMTINDVKRCAVDILVYIDKICKENNIRYYLCAGTLLGAVRHHGFIPWDDDIDIMMPREEYERLLSIWPADTDYFFLTHKNTKNFPYAFGKVVDSRTIKIEPLRKSSQIIGVDVDVFPIDELPDDDIEAVEFYKKLAEKELNVKRQLYTFTKLLSMRSFAHNLLVFINRLMEFINFKSVDKMVEDYSILAQRYRGKNTNHWGVTTINCYGIRERNVKKNYEQVVNVKFEGKEYPAPIGYKVYLTGLYGDYMQLPPVEKRISHHSFKAFWK